VLSRETTNTNIKVLGLKRPGLEPNDLPWRTRGEHVFKDIYIILQRLNYLTQIHKQTV